MPAAYQHNPLAAAYPGLQGSLGAGQQIIVVNNGGADGARNGGLRPLPPERMVLDAFQSAAIHSLQTIGPLAARIAGERGPCGMRRRSTRTPTRLSIGCASLH